MAKNTNANLTDREIAAFCAQIGMLLNSGISVAEGIRIMLEDNDSREGRRLLTAVLEHCELGGAFSDALEKAGVFPRYMVDMVRIGEASGRLDEVMNALQSYYEREDTLRKNIRSAVRYPAVMIVMMVVVVGVLVAKVLPIFSQVFSQLGVAMTGFSAAVLRFGLVLSRSSLVLMIILVLAALAAMLLFGTARGRALRRQLGLKFFATRGTYERLARARFAGGMAMMLSSGLDTDKSLQLVARLVDHPLFEKRIAECQALMAQGTPFADALVQTKLFSGVYGRMISIGFRTGSADTVMQELADRTAEEMQEEVNDRIWRIEPTLVAVFSVIVGIILLSVMLPLMGIMASIG